MILIQKSGKELRFRLVLLVLMVVMMSSHTWAAAAAATTNESGEDDRMRQERLQSKPWYLRNVQVLGLSLPFSPITLVVLVLSIANLIRGFFQRKSWAEASHILIASPTDATKKKMEVMKKEIGNDPMKFAKCARESSACPSKQNGGNLGKFKPTDMAPPFDRAVFDEQNPVGETIGPVQTTFGWHLIFIHQRYIHAGA